MKKSRVSWGASTSIRSWRAMICPVVSKTAGAAARTVPRAPGTAAGSAERAGPDPSAKANPIAASTGLVALRIPRLKRPDAPRMKIPPVGPRDRCTLSRHGLGSESREELRGDLPSPPQAHGHSAAAERQHDHGLDERPRRHLGPGEGPDEERRPDEQEQRVNAHHDLPRLLVRPGRVCGEDAVVRDEADECGDI